MKGDKDTDVEAAYLRLAGCIASLDISNIRVYNHLPCGNELGDKKNLFTNLKRYF
jgi:hypothetical protein